MTAEPHAFAHTAERVSEPEPTPWAVICLSVALLGTATAGGYFFGSINNRVTNVEQKVDDFKKEVREAIQRSQVADQAMTAALTSLQTTVAILGQKLDTLVDQHKNYPDFTKIPGRP